MRASTSVDGAVDVSTSAVAAESCRWRVSVWRVDEAPESEGAISPRAVLLLGGSGGRSALSAAAVEASARREAEDCLWRCW